MHREQQLQNSVPQPSLLYVCMLPHFDPFAYALNTHTHTHIETHTHRQSLNNNDKRRKKNLIKIKK